MQHSRQEEAVVLTRVGMMKLSDRSPDIVKS